jgi:hypothetical protein
MFIELSKLESTHTSFNQKQELYSVYTDEVTGYPITVSVYQLLEPRLKTAGVLEM